MRRLILLVATAISTFTYAQSPSPEGNSDALLITNRQPTRIIGKTENPLQIIGSKMFIIRSKPISMSKPIL
jgi:hypothetical protein